MGNSLFLKNRRRQEGGNALIEYILALSLFALAVFAGSAILAQDADQAFANVASNVGGGTIGTSSPTDVGAANRAPRRPN